MWEMDWREDQQGEPTSSDSPALDGCPRLALSSAPATALAPDARPPATTMSSAPALSQGGSQGPWLETHTFCAQTSTLALPRSTT